MDRYRFRSYGSKFFLLYVDNSLQQGGGATVAPGSVVKLVPFLIGTEEIYVNGTTCGTNQANFTVVLNPLPVIWSSTPIAKIKNNQTYLSWSAATQINNDKYIIEHSNVGRSFSPIGEIEGDGTSNITKHYEYIHTSPSIEMNYYRIKQLDYDGKYSYSDIASVRYDGSGETSIYPNPATSEVTISTIEPASVQVMDVYGRLLSKQDISEGKNTINLTELPTGILIFAVGDQRFKVLKD